MESPKFISWINNTFDMSSVTVVLQTEWCLSTHIQSSTIFLLMIKKHAAAILIRRQSTGLYAFWPHIDAWACNVCHPNITALKTSVDRGNESSWAGTALSKAARLSDAFMRVTSLWMAVILKKWNNKLKKYAIVRLKNIVFTLQQHWRWELAEVTGRTEDHPLLH